jgi:ribosomal protein L10
VAPSQKDGACPEDKPPQPDWAKVFTDLLCHTSVGIFDIPKMTIPQIDAIRSKLGENIALKVGMPGLFGGAIDTLAPSSPTDKPPKLSEFMNFANAFNGI